eukprot:scaffold54817_cov73-Phaeocystis_antarctica.AAC.11
MHSQRCHPGQAAAARFGVPQDGPLHMPRHGHHEELDLTLARGGRVHGVEVDVRDVLGRRDARRAVAGELWRADVAVVPADFGVRREAPRAHVAVGVAARVVPAQPGIREVDARARVRLRNLVRPCLARDAIRMALTWNRLLHEAPVVGGVGSRVALSDVCAGASWGLSGSVRRREAGRRAPSPPGQSEPSYLHSGTLHTSSHSPSFSHAPAHPATQPSRAKVPAQPPGAHTAQRPGLRGAHGWRGRRTLAVVTLEVVARVGVRLAPLRLVVSIRIDAVDGAFAPLEIVHVARAVGRGLGARVVQVASSTTAVALRGRTEVASAFGWKNNYVIGKASVPQVIVRQGHSAVHHGERQHDEGADMHVGEPVALAAFATHAFCWCRTIGKVVSETSGSLLS